MKKVGEKGEGTYTVTYPNGASTTLVTAKVEKGGDIISVIYEVLKKTDELVDALNGANKKIEKLERGLRATDASKEN